MLMEDIVLTSLIMNNSMQEEKYNLPCNHALKRSRHETSSDLHSLAGNTLPKSIFQSAVTTLFDLVPHHPVVTALNLCHPQYVIC